MFTSLNQSNHLFFLYRPGILMDLPILDKLLDRQPPPLLGHLKLVSTPHPHQLLPWQFYQGVVPQGEEEARLLPSMQRLVEAATLCPHPLMVRALEPLVPPCHLDKLSKNQNKIGPTKYLHPESRSLNFPLQEITTKWIDVLSLGDELGVQFPSLKCRLEIPS